MNNKYIFDLTVRLSKALDQNYDVVNMDTVIAVISALEGATITKEQLETTRLAKYINQLRRRTKSEHLARRAKSLLKKWREMVGIQQTNETSSVNNTATTVASNNTILPDGQHRTSSSNPIGFSFETVNSTKTNTSHADFLRSTVSNAASTSYLTKSANLIVHNNNKSASKGFSSEDQSVTCLSPPATAISNEKQPTSFANLLTSLRSESQTRFVVKKSNEAHFNKKSKFKENGENHCAEAFSIDHSSNSNSDLICRSTTTTDAIPPIVIDIEDSDSDSTINYPNNAIKLPLGDGSSSVQLTKGATPAAAVKKKPRKEKAKRSRENDDTLCGIKSMGKQISSASNPHSFIADESKSEFSALNVIGNSEPVSNISEILSLSNSSMSSMCLVEGLLKSKDDTKFPNVSANSCLPSNNSLLDLSFAGKFQQHNSPQLALEQNQHPTDATDLKSTCVDVGPSQRFIPFSSSGCNSHNSSSRSSFDVGPIDFDGISQDNELKSIDKVPKPIPKGVSEKQAIIVPESRTMAASTLTPVHPGNVDVLFVGTANSINDKKVPKKRGRKKGSKGVDSIIAKQTSLSSQMLLTTLTVGAKKVKTTKELFVEMQNRKLGIAKNEQQMASRPNSSCSEPSLHSPHMLDTGTTNASVPTSRATPENFFNHSTILAESDSDTMTSEPSVENFSLQRHEKGVSSLHEYHSFTSKKNEKLSAGFPTVMSIEEQLRTLLNQLPAPPSIGDIELECLTETVPCTCKISEINNALSVENADEVGASNGLHFESENSEGKLIVEAVKLEKNNSIELKSNQLKVNKKLKSIFDFDFDEDEDPLQTLLTGRTDATTASDMEFQATSSFSQGSAQTISFEVTSAHAINTSQQAQLTIIEDASPEQQTVESSELIPLYQREEDPHCVAKQKFDIQRQQITQYHINALHNCFIPNVNGNWDNGNTRNSCLSLEASAAESYVPTDPNNYSVVPKYGSLINEHLRKDLNDVGFTKNFEAKIKNVRKQKTNELPFLGVAKKFLKRKICMEYKVCKDNVLLLDREGILTLKTVEKNQLHCLSTKSEVSVDKSNPKLAWKNEIKAVLKKEAQVRSSSNNSVFQNITIDVADFMENRPRSPNQSVKSQDLLTIANNVQIDYEEQHEILQSGNNLKVIDEVLLNRSFESTQRVPSAAGAAVTAEEIVHTNSTLVANCFNNKSGCNGQEAIHFQLTASQSFLQDQTALIQKKHLEKRRRTLRVCKKCSYSYGDVDESHVCKKRHYLKRIKIALNGDGSASRQLSATSTETSSDDEFKGEESQKPAVLQVSEVSDKISPHCQNSTSDLCDQFDNTNKLEHTSTELLLGHDEDSCVAEGDESFVDDYHEVVEREVSSSYDADKNRFVLSINKNSRKTSKPANSPNSVSPSAAMKSRKPHNTHDGVDPASSAAPNDLGIKVAPEYDIQFDPLSMLKSKNGFKYSVKPEGDVSSTCYAAFITENFKLHSKPKQRRQRHRMKRRVKRSQKYHHSLFFPYEIYVGTERGFKDKVINMSSCSSCCTDESSNDSPLEEIYDEHIKESHSEDATAIPGCSGYRDAINEPICSDNCYCSHNGELNSEGSSGSESETDVVDRSKDCDEAVNKEEKTDLKSESEPSHGEVELPFDNNELLFSFNNIYRTEKEKEEVDKDNIGIKTSDGVSNCKQATCFKQDMTQLVNRNENCDEYTLLNRNIDNLNLSRRPNEGEKLNNVLDYSDSNRLDSCKNHSSSDTTTDYDKIVKINEMRKAKTTQLQLIPYKEYQIGLRAVDEDVQDAEGNNCARIQQFKEWHQVLQLHSYNNELLTVLPYVVLD